MPLDTRTASRRPIKAVAEFKPHESMAASLKLNIPNEYIKSDLLDISIAGLALDSPYLIPINTTLRIRIDTAVFGLEHKEDTPEQISIVGKVTSCAMNKGRYRLGVNFVEISKEDLALIESFIQSKDHRKATRFPLT